LDARLLIFGLFSWSCGTEVFHLGLRHTSRQDRVHACHLENPRAKADLDVMRVLLNHKAVACNNHTLVLVVKV